MSLIDIIEIYSLRLRYFFASPLFNCKVAIHPSNNSTIYSPCLPFVHSLCPPVSHSLFLLFPQKLLVIETISPFDAGTVRQMPPTHKTPSRCLP